MSQTVITSAFEQLKAQEAANGGVVILDEFVFANVPNLDITSPIDRGEGLPDAALIVHRQAVGKTGMVNNNAVVYSVVMGADVGDFDFNWVGLVNKANNVVAMIVHAPTQKKIKTATGQQGNVLTRSFLMEYNGASEQTQIITPADTWQIDFTARLNGVDERIRCENMDIYGEASFFGDGFLVSKTGSQYVVKKGTGYISGVRAEMLFDQNIEPGELPAKVWVDVCWKGTLTSVWDSSTKITVSDFLESYHINDEQHYVFAIAEIDASGEIKDFRKNESQDNSGLITEISKWKRGKVTSHVNSVSQALDTSNVSIWEYADRIKDKPDETDPSTWDWSPAFSAAHKDNVCANLIDGEIYTLKTPVVFEYTSDAYSDYARLPKCRNGLAVIDYSLMANGGAGFNSSLDVDDPAQPAYEAAFTVKGLSGHVVLQVFEGIVFKGNANTAAIKLIGCDGVKPYGCVFANNRYGVVFNNGLKSGVYTELCVPEFCRFRGGCLTAIAYERGGGDSSFHGCGLGEGCYVTVTAGRSPVLIGAGCQPYNAPLNANIWMSGLSAPVIQNKGLTAHFYGNLKLEASFKTVLASGTAVYFYGPISAWSAIDKGTLTQAVRGGPTGPGAGNLNFSGITEPHVTRWDVDKAGTTVPFCVYNEEAIVTVRGNTYYSIFKIISGRRQSNTATTSPIMVVSGNVNPATKFNIIRTASGLSLTTIEDGTIIVSRRTTNLPDESNGANFSTVDYWRKL
ncbi:phage tail-collar fiber domain-containing protein [Klebsiella pneumoniae]|uniref:phage tail-collar fiber domain-containing protein n=1 Tax=Klebsiella pneumoniae TaxID=573 RepID=UPI000E2A5B5F|nr:phage tail protein [Klebsiella pneumoniae]MDU4281042.1 phage tail protein [Klebsiella pneumoniae]SYI17999.1 Tail fiber protein [Klebsiella pneumoniae]